MGEEASQQAVSSDTITREELVARAMQLVPVLRERAHEAEGIRRVPTCNVQALEATVQDHEGQMEDEGEFLVPVGDVEIQDGWYVVGLSGTGSCSIVGQDVFVPAHRMLSLRRAIAGDYSGAHIHDGILYRSAIVPVLALALTGPALGIAKAALDDFGARLPGRVVAFTAQEKQLEMPTTHLQVAEAAIGQYFAFGINRNFLS